MIKLLCKPVLILSAALTLTACGGGASGGGPDSAEQSPASNSDLKTFDSLVRTFSIQSEECPNGGIEIEIGIDSNGNGRLDPEETDHNRTQTTCHGTNGSEGISGTDGTNGNSSLISITSATVDECAVGGKKILIGVDLNANNILDADEALQTEIICNQAISTGIKIGSLVSTSVEQPGNNCAAGGIRIDTGLDINSDQVLAASDQLCLLWSRWY